MFFFLAGLSFSSNAQKSSRIIIEEVSGENRVIIKIDGKEFTSYIWPDDMKKPVLYPLRSAEGIIITRGFPLDPAPGERVDHPHHVGHWLNYGNVNGLDFWNNSYAIPENKKEHYGTIKHEKIKQIKYDKAKGILEVETSWRDHKGEILLKEESRFIFSGDINTRSVERHTTLTALDDPVEFKDNKEGFFAIRMAREFEFPTDKPLTFTDEEGNPTEVKCMNNEGVNGTYLSSEGIRDEDVWGTRAKWMSLSAEKEGEKISVVIMDHPDNPGFPTYWHARTYGLFSANPLGQSVFSDGKEKMNLSLNAGESVKFKYKIYIRSGDFATKKELEKAFGKFAE